MKRVKNSFIATAIVAAGLVAAAPARASILLEPHLGYIVSGNADYTALIKADYKGPEYGARMGGQFLGFMVGLDYTHSTFETESKVLTLSGKDKSKRDQIGLFAGYSFPILLRAWGTYYFSDKTTQTSNGFIHQTGDWAKGSGWKIGVGFTPLPLLSLNLEYGQSSYDKSNTGALSPKLEPKEVVLGVSLPLTFL